MRRSARPAPNSVVAAPQDIYRRPACSCLTSTTSLVKGHAAAIASINYGLLLSSHCITGRCDCLFGFISPELLGEPDEKPFGAANVAQPIGLLVLHHVTDELRAMLLQSGERLVDIFNGEHDA
jgi:hypothetical protein